MIKPSQSIAFYFGTQTPSTGAAVNADSTPTCVVYKNGAVDVAVTPTVTNPATGSYKVAFTVPSGYAAGDIVEVLATATVSSVSSPPTSVFLDTVDTARESETYARLGAPVGASIAADIAAIPAAVWAVGTRTLTSFGTLVADIWANVTRTLTDGGGATAQQVWEYATRTITGGGGSAADIWAYTTRTLTQSAASVAAALNGSTITKYRGETWSIALTGLGSLSGYSKIYFALKEQKSDTDAQALVLIELAAGLTVLNGAAYATSANGSITVDDQGAGNLTITVKPAATTLLEPRGGLHYGVKMVTTGGVVRQLSDGAGKFNIAADNPRAIT